MVRVIICANKCLQDDFNVLSDNNAGISPPGLVVRNMTGTILDSDEIPAGVDLKRRFAVAMLQWMDAGWQLGEFSSTGGTFFCAKGPSDG